MKTAPKKLPSGLNKITAKYITDWKGFDDFWNMAPMPGKSYTERYGELDRQIETAKSLLTSEDTLSHAKSVDFAFDTDDPRVQSKLLAEVPALWNRLLDMIDINDNWMVFYNYGDVWRSRKLDEVNREYFKDQIAEDFQKPDGTIPGGISIQVKEKNYDFLPVSIRQLKALRFVNTSKFNAGARVADNGDVVVDDGVEYWEDSEQYKKLVGLGLTQEELDDSFVGWERRLKKAGKKPRKKPQPRKRKQGSFWKWTLKFPINLERYMIFNELNDRTIKLMEGDNCLIYACKQYGISQDIIDHMKDIIKTKSFTMSKLKEISKDIDIGFIIEEKDGRHHKIGNQDGVVVPLLLMNEHYMLNERVKIAPYYIKHYYDILADKVAMKKSLEDRQLINKRREINGKKYYISEKSDYPLKLVLKTLFNLNYFESIKMGDYYTYASTLYKYKLDPIDDLEYNPKFCVRLKAPLIYKVNKDGVSRSRIKER